MLLTVRDAARMLNVSTGCVYSLIAANRLPHYRVGVGRGRIRLREEDVEAYLAERRVEGPPADRSQGVQPRRLRHLRH